ncbi:MAG: hypothetical protein ACREEM_45330 [Blastocatellia bacterium]
MMLTVDLKPETEAALHEEAARAGLDAGHFIQRTLEERLKRAVNGYPGVSPLSGEESKLLRQVNEWLPSETWEKYQELREKFRAETLTEAEHQRLIEIYDQIEVINAQRIAFIAELARFRGLPLKEMMNQLGIAAPGSGFR